MNLDAAEFRIALIGYFTILVLWRPLRDPSQIMPQSANNKVEAQMNTP
jgi:hypothetical protein